MFVKATTAAFLWTIISAKPTCDQFDDEGNMLLSECLTEGQTPELAIAIGVALVLQNYDQNIFQVFRHFSHFYCFILFTYFDIFSSEIESDFCLLSIIGAGVYFMCIKKNEDTADATEEDMEYSTLARNEVKATAGTIVEQTV